MGGRTLIDRRRMLLAGALVGGAAAAPGEPRPPAASSQTFSGTMPWQEGQASNPQEVASQGYRFFGPDEAAFIEAAVDRIIPPDHNGPGAKDVGVPLFLDRQLGGDFGKGDHYYLQGPWPEGVKEQGYQTRYSPAELYRKAISGVNAWCGDKYGKPFNQLSTDQMDATLKACESGDAKLKDVSAKTWFTLFLQNVQEGFWSDPIYGGNRDMAGWKMIGFPGAHYDYSEWIDHVGEPWPHPPVGLKGRSAWAEG